MVVVKSKGKNGTPDFREKSRLVKYDSIWLIRSGVDSSSILRSRAPSKSTGFLAGFDTSQLVGPAGTTLPFKVGGSRKKTASPTKRNPGMEKGALQSSAHR